MGDILNLFKDDESQDTENNKVDSYDNQNSGSIQLHREELDIKKNKVDAGEVVLSKEIVEEQKTVDVPVMHDEVVIKRTPIKDERSDGASISEETIHIPVSQEQVDVNKYTVTTEEVSALKREVEETHHVQETLKHEEAHVNTTGTVDIVSDDSNFKDIND